jgi:hypothetical protein
VSVVLAERFLRASLIDWRSRMFCPECGAEYREGFRECSDCHVFLVDEEDLSSDREVPRRNLELVTLLELEDPIQLSLVRSLLESEGIPCLLKGESVHTLGGVGIMGRRKTRLQVASEDLQKAKELVEGFEFTDDGFS